MICGILSRLHFHENPNTNRVHEKHTSGIEPLIKLPYKSSVSSSPSCAISFGNGPTTLLARNFSAVTAPLPGVQVMPNHEQQSGSLV